MKFSIGDKIVLKQTGEEGTVAGFIGKDMLEVEVNGTHFPVYADEVDHPYLKWFTEKKQLQKKTSPPEQLPVEKEKTRPPRLARGIYLSFMPVFRPDEMEDIVDQLKIYLVNETPVSIRFSYEMSLLGSVAFRHEGTLHSFGHIYLHPVEYGDMNDQPRFNWRLADGSNTAMKTEEGTLRIKPARLFAQIGELLQKNEAMFSYLLVSDFVEKPKAASKETIVPPAVPQKPLTISSFSELPRYEVDLHIEELVPDYKGLSNAEIMDIQLRTLERYLHLAIMHRQERMIIIHGLGTGALKDAAHKMLKEYTEVRSYRNEWMGKYGYGATEVIFRY